MADHRRLSLRLARIMWRRGRCDGGADGYGLDCGQPGMAGAPQPIAVMVLRQLAHTEAVSGGRDSPGEQDRPREPFVERHRPLHAEETVEIAVDRADHPENGER